jgi:hypothetical protein
MADLSRAEFNEKNFRRELFWQYGALVATE